MDGGVAELGFSVDDELMTLGLIFHPEATFLVSRNLETEALTSWHAAYTGSEHCVIPGGTLLRLRRDVGGVVEPTERVRYELIDHPEGEAYIGMVFPAAIEAGLFEDPGERPDKWRKVIDLGSRVECYAANHAELEERLIPEETRRHPKYGGYWFSLPLTAIGDGIDFIADGCDIAVQRDARLYVKEPFDADGLRSDGVAAKCRVRAEALLAPRHAVEERHLVAGWELTYKDHTWWRTDEPGATSGVEWVRAERACPSRFLANCGEPFADAVEADGDREALMVPTDLIGTAIVIM